MIDQAFAYIVSLGLMVATSGYQKAQVACPVDPGLHGAWDSNMSLVFLALQHSLNIHVFLPVSAVTTNNSKGSGSSKKKIANPAPQEAR